MSWTRHQFWFDQTQKLVYTGGILKHMTPACLYKFFSPVLAIGLLVTLGGLDFASPVVSSQTSDTTQVLLNVEGQVETDIILIPTERLSYDPSKQVMTTFGLRDLTWTVKETRISQGICNFRIKPYGNPQSDFLEYTPMLTATSTPFDPVNGCQTIFPKNYQSVPRWDLEVRITATNNGKIYGADVSYFFAYGSIGFVAIQGEALD